MQISSTRTKCFVEWQCLALILSEKISDGMLSSSEEFSLFQGCKEDVEPDEYASGGEIWNIKKRLKYGTGEAGTSFV